MKGLEVALLLVIFLAYGFNNGGAVGYILLSVSSWFMAVSWLFAHTYSIHRDLNGRRSLRISETGRIGCFTEVVLGLREKKVGKPGGMKNWHIFTMLVGGYWKLY